MNDGFDVKLRVATVGMLAVVAVALLMNTCAMDRLEKQVIRQAQALESISQGGSVAAGAATRAGSSGTSAAASSAEAGSGTGVVTAGWGGKQAEVLHVEGAVPEGVFRLADKPLPQNDTYVNRRGSPPGSLNYYTTNEGETSTITRNILWELFRPNPDNPEQAQAALATSWDVGSDKQTYTFHLRRGAQFADGRPVTSADVLFSWNVLSDPAVNADHLRAGSEDIESVTAPDPYTVVFKYKKKYWAGIYDCGLIRILDKGWYEEQIPLYAKKLDVANPSVEPGKPGFADVFNKIRVPCPGAGPYYYQGTEYDPAKPIELVQNPFFFGMQTTPRYWNFVKVRWIYISDEIAAFEEFRKQHFDVSVVDFPVYDEQLKSDPTITSIAKYYEYDHMGLGFTYIAWNCRKAPFDDPKVRRAMTMLVNRQWIVDQLNRGRGRVGVGYGKPTYAMYDKTIQPWPFDPEAARLLLAEAGWKDTNGDGVLDKDGKPFEFELKVPSGRRLFVQVAGQLEDACKKVGIRMSLRPLEWATFYQDFQQHRYDAACLLSSFTSAWLDPWSSYHSSQDVPGGGNATGWRNAEVDRVLDASKEEFDPDKRNELFHQFQRIFHQEQPQTILTHDIVGVLVNRRFEDVKVRPTGLQWFDWWVKPENVLYK